jgi:hypothetical protein
MGVGATTNGTARAAFSNYGAGLNVVGFGGYNAANSAGGYSNVSGTSFASPQAAALASLVWALDQSLTNMDIYIMMQEGARPLGGGYNIETGYGCIDMGKTLQLAVESAGGLLPPETPVYDFPPVITTETADEPEYAPMLTLVGSNPIILHIGGTDYVEQGALAVDELDGDISDYVEIIGTVDTSSAGNYTITYRVVNSLGIEAVATREVRLLAPATETARMPYGFSGQGKQGSVIIHRNIISDAFGWMDLRVSAIDKNMSITVKLINTATQQVVLADTFSAADSRQYMIDEGNYELQVTVDKANGNSKYDIQLLMPEVMYVTFAEDEAPLSEMPQTGFADPAYVILVAAGVLLGSGVVLSMGKRKASDK